MLNGHRVNNNKYFCVLERPPKLRERKEKRPKGMFLA
jgi:hypothetical protein